MFDVINNFFSWLNGGIAGFISSLQDLFLSVLPSYNADFYTSLDSFLSIFGVAFNGWNPLYLVDWKTVFLFWTVSAGMLIFAVAAELVLTLVHIALEVF